MKDISENTNYKLEIYDSFDELKKFNEQWNELVSKTDYPSPYLTFEWFETWWECFKSKNKQLHIVLIWYLDELVGISPLMLVTLNKLCFKLKKIEFISMMRHAYSPFNLSGYLDFIIKQTHQKEVIALILKHLIQLKFNWHYIRLHPIISTSETLSYLEKFARGSGYPYHRRRVFYNYNKKIDSSWDEFIKKLKKEFIKKLISRERKLKSIGPVEILVFETPEGIDKAYSFVLEIENKSWKAKKGIHIDSNRYNHFFYRLIKKFSNKGWMKILILNANKENIAYDIIIYFGSKAIGLKTSYNLSYARYGVGNIMSYYSFKKIFENQFKEFNLLWGNQDSKSIWAPTVEQHDEIFVFKNNLIAKLMLILYHKMYLYRIIRYIINRYIDK